MTDRREKDYLLVGKFLQRRQKIKGRTTGKERPECNVRMKQLKGVINKRRETLNQFVFKTVPGEISIFI